MRWRTSSSRISAPPPGMESRPASRSRAIVVAQVEPGVFGDGQHLRGRKAVQPDLRKALLDAAKQPLEPVDLEIGMNAALHQHARAAHLHGLGNLLVNLLEVEDVAFVGAGIGLAGPGQRAVEGAEGAVLGAEVGVVDVAIDDVGDNALGVQAPAHRVGLESQADQVGRVEVIQGLLARDRHSFDSSNSLIEERTSGPVQPTVARQGAWKR